MRDYQSLKVINDFFRGEKRRKKAEHMRMEKNKNKKRSSQKKQKKQRKQKKKGKMR